jgi:hypothetical protein
LSVQGTHSSTNFLILFIYLFIIIIWELWWKGQTRFFGF